MAFNAEFRDANTSKGVLTEKLYSVEDGSLLGMYRAFIAGAGKCMVIANVKDEEPVVKRFGIRSVSDLAGNGRSVLRKAYREYKGETRKSWSSPVEETDSGKTSEQGVEAADFKDLNKEN